MIIGKYEKKEISVSQLDLDTENFRIGKHSNQPNTIRAMLTRSGTKVVGLAESIRANGFLDLETLCVFPAKDDGHFVVAEGNRRITALKTLATPELAYGTPSYQRLKKLSETSKITIPKKVVCAVFKDRKECLAYVLMRHGYGASDGSGLVLWDSISRLRADAYVNNVKHPELDVIDFVVDEGSLGEVSQQALADDDFNITNLQRLTDDPAVRKLFGISTSNCTSSSHGKQWLVPVWQRIVETIIQKLHRGQKFTVDNNLNNAALRKQFAEEVLEDVHGITSGGGETQTKKDEDQTQKPPPDKGAEPKAGAKKKKPAVKHQTTKQRKGLVAKSFAPIKLEPQKVINIVAELKALSVKDYNNCAGVMFRVLLELSVANYMKKNKIKDKKPNPKPSSKLMFVDLTLREKISAVEGHLSSKLDAKTLKPFSELKDAKHPMSADSLNQYVHSDVHMPNPDSLKISWDNLQHIFEMLWEK
jgi:hypothetical protein